ncbi:MAG: sulfatase, partial [Victivallales bacterium]|nr:sulfatase [Victivallales bacterium]
TLMELMDIETDIQFDGESLLQLVYGEKEHLETEFYITECTWMRKHGWRTPEWKLMVALEPDFHFKPTVELYNLCHDPEELTNVAEDEPELVAMLRSRMEAFIAKREGETGRTNPMYTQECWHGHDEVGQYFTSSQQAYDTMHIGDAKQAAKLQDKKK